MTALQHQFEPWPPHRPAPSTAVSPPAATDRLELALGGEFARFLLDALAGEPEQRLALVGEPSQRRARR